MSAESPRRTGFMHWLGRATVVVMIFVGGYVLGRLLAPAVAPVVPGSATQPAAETEWTCSMHPEVHLPEPGVCPKCGMKLIPRRVRPSTERVELRQFVTSDEAKALMNIETAVVERRFVTAEVRMVGKVDYDETRVKYITAWVPGRLDRLYVDYTGVPVKKGDHLVYVYSPELYSAQEELFQALEAVKNLEKSHIDVLKRSTASTVEAAREKLRLWGLKSEQIAEIEKRGTPKYHLTIYSPMDGIVIHKNAQEGMYVNTGTRIYTVADLSAVWVKLDAYESDLMWVRYGQQVEFTTVSHPGETFTGTISFIDPVLNPRTRTVKVRVNAPNPEGKLKPEMFVKAVVRSKRAAGGMVVSPALSGKWICPMHPSVIKDKAGACDICGMPLVRTESLGYVSAEPSTVEKPLVIPVSAALVTGTRAIVYVEVPGKDQPTYEGREIVLGPRAGDDYIVRSGLEEGDRVVVKGNFKIDSALQIQAKPSMMTPEGGGGGGHHHGGGGASKSMSASGMDMRMDLPPMVRDQLHVVLSVAEAGTRAAEAADLDGSRAAFAKLDQAVKDVDMSKLTGHAHMLWMEMMMRLTNDAIEGREVKTRSDLRRVAKSLVGNISSLRTKFGLTHAGHEHQPAASR